MIQVKEFIKIVDDRSTKLNFVYKLKLKDDFTDFYSEYTLFSTLCNINNLINFEEKVTFFSEKYSDSDLKKFSVRLICWIPSFLWKTKIEKFYREASKNINFFILQNHKKLSFLKRFVLFFIYSSFYVIDEDDIYMFGRISFWYVDQQCIWQF